MTMVERMGKAIRETDALKWCGELAISQAEAERMALAALKAIEPTEGMLAVGADEFNDYTSAFEKPAESASRVFKSMMRAALSEAERNVKEG